MKQSLADFLEVFTDLDKTAIMAVLLGLSAIFLGSKGLMWMVRDSLT